MDIEMSPGEISDALCHFERTRCILPDILAYMITHKFIRRGPLVQMIDSESRWVGYSLTGRGIRIIANAGYSHEQPPICQKNNH